MHRPARRNFGLIILASIVVIFLISTPVNQSLIKLQILPSFEGLNSGVEGAEIYSGFYRIDQQLPSPYQWINSDPKSTIFQGNVQYQTPATVRIETNNPQLSSDPFSLPKTVHYWVRASETGPYYEVVGKINVYAQGMTFSAINNPGILPDSWFAGERIWLTETAVTWNRALQQQELPTGAIYGQAWEAPLGVVIVNYNVQACGDHCQLDPSISGRWISLYSTPQQLGTISDLGLQAGADINGTLVGDFAPDSRLKQSAFFSVTMSDFGTTDHFFGQLSDTPVANYALKIYSIQLGKYTYTNPDNTPWGVRPPQNTDIFTLIAQWLANPFNLLGLGAFGVIVIVAVVGVVLVYFFGLPRRHPS